MSNDYEYDDQVELSSNQDETQGGSASIAPNFEQQSQGTNDRGSTRNDTQVTDYGQQSPSTKEWEPTRNDTQVTSTATGDEQRSQGTNDWLYTQNNTQTPSFGTTKAPSNDDPTLSDSAAAARRPEPLTTTERERARLTEAEEDSKQRRDQTTQGWSTRQ